MRRKHATLAENFCTENLSKKRSVKVKVKVKVKVDEPELTQRSGAIVGSDGYV